MSNKSKKERYLVTSALPYANGDLHIGQIAGAYLPADIFVRYLRINKKDVIYICGTDEHGAPISIKAEAEETSPRKIVDKYHKIIKDSFKGLNIEFDNFSGTSRNKHISLSQRFFLSLYNKGYISKKKSKQFYCNHDKRFLADRYVEGICPYCKHEGARGDQCDNCGKLIEAIKLIEPVCKLCGNKPVVKKTTHWYLDLPKFETKLLNWLETKDYWRQNVLNFIMSWIKEGLKERAITRDLDWGVPVPLENTKGKVLYVWFDAPIGYISSTMEWAEKIDAQDKWKDYWLNPDTRLIHFLGKDNIPFHTIIWPSVLMEQDDNYIMPYDVPANEYLNIKGRKISTSKNLAVWVQDYLKYFDGELLRYVLTAIAPETKDSDFSWDKFQAKVNNDLANILGNLANRVFLFSIKNFNGLIEKPNKMNDLSQKSLKLVKDTIDRIDDCYRNYHMRKAAKLIIDIARIGNKYFDETKPWIEVKSNKSQAKETMYVCAEMLRLISIVFYPILPRKMKKLRKMMGLKNNVLWKNTKFPLTTIKLNHIEPLFRKISDNEIEKQNEILEKSQSYVKTKLKHKKEISYEDFVKMELRVVKIISAEKIKKSNKLLKIKVKLNDEEIQVVAGIAQYYNTQELIGKKAILLFNLKKIKLMGLESQGMLLAAEGNNKLSLITIDKDIEEGSEVL